MKKVLTLVTLGVLTLSMNSFASEILVTINKSKVDQSDEMGAFGDLLTIVTAPINCSYEASIREYIPADKEAPYYGTAVIDVSDECLRTTVSRIAIDGRYTIHNHGKLAHYAR